MQCNCGRWKKKKRKRNEERKKKRKDAGSQEVFKNLKKENSFENGDRNTKKKKKMCSEEIFNTPVNVGNKFLFQKKFSKDIVGAKI